MGRGVYPVRWSMAASTPDRYVGAMSDHVVVVGGGLLGCATAWELARRGVAVTLLEKVIPGAEASSAAAGILAPRMEAHGHAEARAIGVESLSLYRSWAEALPAPVDLVWNGLIRVVGPEEDVEATRPDVDAVWLGPAELKRREAVGAARGGWWLPEEGSVDPRKLVVAVHAAALMAGARVKGGTEVVAVTPERVALADGSHLEGRVVVCAGAWTARVPGLGRLPVRPVRGQMMAVRGAAAPRAVLFGAGGYAVPRVDGRTLVGATVEEVGFARGVTVAGLRHLTGVATGLLPGLAEAEVLESWSGFRPGTPDGLPIVGEVDGVFVASGHFRNGILLAPLTARWVADALLVGVAPPDGVDPGRFAAAAG